MGFSLSGLSHRRLNDQFHATLGCSIGKQLTRSRFDTICQLLNNTDLRVQEIANTGGYSDERHFSRYFKRAIGLTPQAYRRKISPRDETLEVVHHFRAQRHSADLSALCVMQ